MVQVGASLDLTLQPDDPIRWYRVLILLIAMLMLLFFLAWGSISGLIQRVFLATVSLWLVTAGQAVLNERQSHPFPRSP